MDILIDTNILVAAANKSDPMHAPVIHFIEALEKGGNRLCVVAQNIYEYWVVATRPINVNGLGMTPAEARRCIEDLRNAYVVLNEPADAIDRWLQLCEQNGVKGRSAHDARLVAAMLAYDIKKFVTRNISGFARYSEIQCLVPS